MFVISSKKAAAFSLLYFVVFLHPPHGCAIGANQTSPPPPPAIIIFGDSIVDPGNNNAILTTIKCNFPPYGKDFVGHKATGRFSNGKIPSDIIGDFPNVVYLTAYLGTELSAYDLITGVSFASGGCGFDPLTSQLVVSFIYFLLTVSQGTEDCWELKMIIISSKSAAAATSLLSFVVFLLPLHGCALGANQTSPRPPAIIIFGDSIVDPGNNNAILTIVKCNYPPYGKDFVGRNATGRFSNGKIPSDIIGDFPKVAAYLEKDLSAYDLITGVSFASGGCGFDPLTSQLVVSFIYFMQTAP